MSIITTGTFAAALLPGVKKWVGTGYGMVPENWKQIYEMNKSNRHNEFDFTSGGMGLMSIKPESSDFGYDSMTQGFKSTYTHVTYGLGYRISQEAIEDNLYPELVKYRSAELGKCLAATRNTLAFNVLNNAFSNSYVGGDGLELCSTAHLLERGGTYRNELATSADFSEASLETAVIDIATQFKDGGGKLIEVRPKRLIVPVQLEFEVKRVLGSELQSDSAENNINALRAMNSIPAGVVSSSYLTDTDAWFIQTDAMNGLKMYERRGEAVENDTDFNSKNVAYSLTWRGSFGWTDPRGIYGSPGA